MDEPQYWMRWDGGMYEYIGRDHNNDPLMSPIDGGETISISPRALYRTWHPKWKSVCCDRWLNYEPDPDDTVCFHRKN